MFNNLLSVATCNGGLYSMYLELYVLHFNVIQCFMNRIQCQETLQ